MLTSWALDRSDQRVRVLRGDEQVAEVTSYAVTPPIEPNLRLLTVGERRLRAALLLPTGYQPGDGPLPVLLDPYGGPRAQRVLASRNAFLASQWLADQGFAVLIADGRGTPGRGPAWDREIAFDFAGITLADQVDALHAVAADHPELDLSRVAIRGWSYGGYLSALAVLRRPDVFHAAIAGAPVTDWRLYDTHYTERYLGHPDERPEVYQRNSLIDDAPNLTRPLLIIHGLADDNVVVAHLLNPSRPQPAGGGPIRMPNRGQTNLPKSCIWSPGAVRQVEPDREGSSLSLKDRNLRVDREGWQPSLSDIVATSARPPRRIPHWRGGDLSSLGRLGRSPDPRPPRAPGSRETSDRSTSAISTDDRSRARGPGGSRR